MLFIMKTKNYTVLTMFSSVPQFFWGKKLYKKKNTFFFHVFVFSWEIVSTEKPELAYAERHQHYCIVSYSYVRICKTLGNSWEFMGIHRLSHLLTFKNKSTSEIVLNYKQNIIHEEQSNEHLVTVLLTLEPSLHLCSTSFFIYMHHIHWKQCTALCYW